MAFKLKGMTFGKGTGSESPNKIADKIRNFAQNNKILNPKEEGGISSEAAEVVNKGKQQKMPSVGSEERKAEYDRRGWAYDDTIPGYGAKTDPTEANDAPPANEQVSDQTQTQVNEKPVSTLENIQEQEKPEVERPDYQKRRQQARLDRRRSRGAGTSDTFDIRTDKKEARMKYGRGSEEFKKYKQELKDAKKSKRQERKSNRYKI
jgi:hypothetical protein|tara:strand:- start:2001 stop:2618 length:618 start_codon:yes stop_codon:yes gene_type:complete